jgi:phenylalanyl-tRNA synthetase beta chain
MLFSYTWLQSFFNKKLPEPKKLADLLTLHSFEVKEIKKEGRPACRTGRDWVFDIEVTPNRASDCFSHLGIARECSAFANAKIKNQKSKLKEDKKARIEDFVKIEVKNKNDCFRYTGRVIQGIKVGPSPKWMQERLISCGLQPINNIVDATNYVMLELGQPLHAFDLDKIKSENPKSQIPNPKKIIVRRAKRGEKIEALDDKTYTLDENILVIADTKKPLAIAGIKGGKTAEISSKTKTIFIESANFNPILTRNASRFLKLRTDASFRFEHGLDPNMTEVAVDRVANLIQEIAGGTIAKGKVDFYPKKVSPVKITLNLKKLENVLGTKIPKNKVINILKKLDLKILKTKQELLEIEIPTWRKDLTIEEDLIEEVARIYGYEEISPVPPKSVIKLPEKNLEIIWEKRIKEIMKELGFSEIYNYSFVSRKDAGLYTNGLLIELENPISDEFKYLRPTLLINLIKNVKHNLKYFSQFKIFEIGKIFQNTKKVKIAEKKMFSGVIVGEKADEGFYLLKGIIDALFEKLGISDYFYDEYQPTPEESQPTFWHIKKCAEIKISGTEIGFLGEISLRLLDYYGIFKKVWAFDIDFEKLSKLCSEEQEYQPISRFPAAIRDIAILTPLFTRVEEVQAVIFNVGGKLIRDVDLFDIYVGEEIPEGKKNLAFHIIFQAEDRTLKSDEIDKLMRRIINALEKNLEWEVRKF